MNFAHVHLILNHIPVIGIPMALCFLIYGIRGRNFGAQKFALATLTAIAIFTIPVYFSGEPAEERAEHLPGVTETRVEAHEDAAGAAFALTLLTGAAAAGALVFRNKEKFFRYAVFATVTIAAISVLALGYAANLGGEIRHTEIRSGAATSGPGA